MSVTKNYNNMKKAADFSRNRRDYEQLFINKYFDLFKSQFKIDGLEYQQLDYLLRTLWSDGSVWIRKDNIVNEPVLCKYAGSNFNCYGYPTQVTLVNTNNAPSTMIPNEPQNVDKDGIICWLRPNHKGLYADIIQYIKRIAEAQQAIDTNLYLQKFPWLIITEPENKMQLEAIVHRIVDGEPIVYMSGDVNSITNIKLDTPYIIDKLREYQNELDNNIKTLLGIDNQGGYLNREQQNLDTTNCNNDEINDTENAMFSTIRDGFNRANELLGLKLSIKSTSKPVEQISASKDSGNFEHKEEIKL